MWREHMTSNSRGPQMVLMVERACHATLTSEVLWRRLSTQLTASAQQQSSLPTHADESGYCAHDHRLLNFTAQQFARPTMKTTTLSATNTVVTKTSNAFMMDSEDATGANVQYSITRAHAELVIIGVDVTP